MQAHILQACRINLQEEVKEGGALTPNVQLRIDIELLVQEQVLAHIWSSTSLTRAAADRLAEHNASCCTGCLCCAMACTKLADLLGMCRQTLRQSGSSRS